MVGKLTWAVVFMIFICHLIAFCLSVAAEQHRTQTSLEYDSVGKYYYCYYNSDVSSGMGAGAFVALLAGHLLIMGATRCFCCANGELRGGAKACAIISFILLWLSWFIASICLLAGANRNSIHTKTKSIDIKDFPITCEFMRKGTFGAAAAFTFFDFILAEVYYLLLACSRPGNTSGASHLGWQGQNSPFPPQQSPYAL